MSDTEPPHGPFSQSKREKSRGKGQAGGSLLLLVPLPERERRRRTEVSQPWTTRRWLFFLALRSQVPGPRLASCQPSISLSPLVHPLATLSPPGASAEAAACSSERLQRKCKGKQHHPTRNFLPERFKHTLAYLTRQDSTSGAEWETGTVPNVILMNLSWWNMCFKCKTPGTQRKVEALPQLGPLTEF